jgi:TonB family protein
VYLSQVFLLRKRGDVKFFQLCAIVLGSLIAASGVHAKAIQGVSSAPKSALSTDQQQPYPDTADGLRAFLQQLMTLIQKKNAAQGSTMARDLILPDHQTWFPQVFGPEIGSRMEKQYEESLPQLDAKFNEQMRLYVKEGMTDISVTRLESADQPSKDSYTIRAMQAMQNPVPVYSVAMASPGGTSWIFPGSFVFVQGGYRYLDLQTIRAVYSLKTSGTAPSQGADNSNASSDKAIRNNGSVQVARMIRQVMPAYPAEAKSKHIQGTVVLHAVIGKDGTVDILDVVSGPTELRKAATDAVKQWRYTPTLLNGEPVSVNTTLSVVFALGQK